jgi:hypothetical protein
MEDKILNKTLKITFYDEEYMKKQSDRPGIYSKCWGCQHWDYNNKNCKGSEHDGRKR